MTETGPGRHRVKNLVVRLAGELLSDGSAEHLEALFLGVTRSLVEALDAEGVSTLLYPDRSPKEIRHTYNARAPHAARLPRVPHVEGYPWLEATLSAGRVLRVDAAHPLPPEAHLEHAVQRELGLRSCLGVPILRDGTVWGVVLVVVRQELHLWSDEDERALLAVGNLLAAALYRFQQDKALIEERQALAQRVVERTQALAEANQQLQQALSQNERFVASLSHELRTPLTLLISNSELLAEGKFGPLTPRQINACAQMIRSSEHMHAVLNDVLDLARSRAGHLPLSRDPVDLGTLVRDTVAQAEAQALKAQVQIQAKCEAGTLTVQGDRRRLQQVLFNLLTNALRFAPPGSAVEVGPHISADKNELRLCVLDRGPGISAEDIPHLFQPFSSLSTRKKGGSGLGLALSQRLMVQQGGRLELRHPKGGGCCFCMVFPNYVADTAEPRPLFDADAEATDSVESA